MARVSTDPTPLMQVSKECFVVQQARLFPNGRRRLGVSRNSDLWLKVE